jgi:hypothetical protein
MKNIHVIPTDKPSRLIQNDLDELCYQSKKSFKNDRKNRKKFNIYVTNDEEIKQGDWHLVWLRDKWEVLNYMPSIGYRKECLGKEVCKIILTTDIDLITDGIQPIDDEFLKWFCKNSSCDFVEVKISHSYLKSKKDILTPYYKIIIPNLETLSFEEFRKIASKELLEKFDTDCLEYSEDGDFDNYFYANCKYWESKLKEESKQLFTKGDKVLFTGKMLDENVVDKVVTVFYTLGRGEIDDMSDIMDEYTHVYRVWNKDLKHTSKKEPEQDFEKDKIELKELYLKNNPDRKVIIEKRVNNFMENLKLEPKQETLDFKVWDELFGILAWKFQPTKSGDMYLDAEKVFEELKSKFKLEKI